MTQGHLPETATRLTSETSSATAPAESGAGGRDGSPSSQGSWGFGPNTIADTVALTASLVGLSEKELAELCSLRRALGISDAQYERALDCMAAVSPVIAQGWGHQPE